MEKYSSIIIAVIILCVVWYLYITSRKKAANKAHEKNEDYKPPLSDFIEHQYYSGEEGTIGDALKKQAEKMLGSTGIETEDGKDQQGIDEKNNDQ